MQSKRFHNNVTFNVVIDVGKNVMNEIGERLGLRQRGPLPVSWQPIFFIFMVKVES